MTERLRRTVAGAAVEILAPAGTFTILDALFRSFPEHKPGSSVSVFISWDDDRCRWEVPGIAAGAFRARGEATQLAGTLIVLQHALQVATPGLLIVHGNAIVDADRSGPILIVGESGAGKTTLTRLMLRNAAQTRASLAEDLLLIDPRESTLHSYPRAFLLREEDAHERVDASALRTPGGKIVSPHPGYAAGSIDASEATVVLLRHRQEKDAPTAPRAGDRRHSVVWVTHSDASLADALHEHGLPAPLSNECEGQVRLDFDRVLEADARKTLLELLERHESLVLHSAWDRRTTTGDEAVTARPQRPDGGAIAPEQGLMELLAHTVRSNPHAGSAGGGALFMQLARCFSRARFVAFTPGGTPEQSVRALEGLLA